VRPRWLKSRGEAGRGRPGQQPLHVVHAAEQLAGPLDERRRRNQFGHRVEPGVDGVDVAERIGDPVGEQREPIAVTVWSSTAKSEPSRRPSRIVRLISRLRRVASSICNVSALRNGIKRST